MLPNTLIDASRTLGAAVDRLHFGDPVTHVYNPLRYAWAGWSTYLSRFATDTRRVVLIGMNPGPWGMAQTGVPFGEVAAVREWMGINVSVGTPATPHPKRPIQGFSCPRSEVSGRRLWGLMIDRFAAPDDFFSDCFVANYCPLVFMAESGRNVTPDRLPSVEREPLFALCDDFLRLTIQELQPEFVIGVGKFAEKRAGAVVSQMGVSEVAVRSILHPSPASPAANRDWASTATRQLIEMGAWCKS